MTDTSSAAQDRPAHQQVIWDRCHHPSGTFVTFRREEIEQSIPARFERQVEQHPHRLTVKTPRHHWSYETLNRQVNRLAHAILKRRGSGEEPIALVMENDAPLMAAIMAVLKAGKIYASLPPSDPRPRLVAMLENLRPGLIVTNTRHLKSASELASDDDLILDVDDLDPHLSAENPGLPLSPDNRSWILYTSGSTGQPKGILQNHRNVMHLTMNYTNGLHICSRDRIILLHSGLTLDVFGALLNGAALCPLDIQQDGLAPLADWLVESQVTIYRSFATVFRHFMGTLNGTETFPHLRLIHLGGETVNPHDVELYQRHFSPDCLFINRLGSNESGGMAIYYIDKETEIDGPLVPVGYAVPDSQVLLLDDAGEEVSRGEEGEIAVQSRYLSLGYWRRPDLTQERFRSTPQGKERIYLTGDLGRRRPDGCLDHLGRKDFQVKIRGYRVETVAIENALADLEMVSQAVVMAHAADGSDLRLVAYIVPSRPVAPTVSALRRGLADALPEYMIPSVFVMLDTLPSTSNGKVDRRALPAPTRDRPRLDVPFTSPRTPVEERLAAIWADTLDLNQVGVHDHFLELGGNSLLATQVVSRVLAAFQVKLSLRRLFDAPTVATMAVALTQEQARHLEQAELRQMLAELETSAIDEARQPL